MYLFLLETRHFSRYIVAILSLCLSLLPDLLLLFLVYFLEIGWIISVTSFSPHQCSASDAAARGDAALDMLTITQEDSGIPRVLFLAFLDHIPLLNSTHCWLIALLF